MNMNYQNLTREIRWILSEKPENGKMEIVFQDGKIIDIIKIERIRNKDK